MDVHSGHIGFAVALYHAEEFPSVPLIEVRMIGHKIGGGNALCPQVFHCHIQQMPGDALTAVALFGLYGADIGGQIGPVMEVVLDHSQAANDLAVRQTKEPT